MSDGKTIRERPAMANKRLELPSICDICVATPDLLENIKSAAGFASIERLRSGPL
ncbi:hypothetical protein [Pseudomonas atacamensis]|uniref:hypothetical protein n=1 Tax=Pseudomonas atacamensis TaxID=2565368 RepID=UPI00381A61CA